MAGSGLITILFTDLVGSTALAQQLGDTAADELRREHFEQLRRAVVSTGGTEVKTIGDAMMVSYNSATDAIAGAVAMQQRVHAHNDASGLLGLQIQMRIGISAGDASYENDDLRAAAMFGAATEVSSDAAALEKLLAHSGRRP